MPISPNSRAVAVAMAVSAAFAWHSAARAQQAYPAKPIRLILPFPPGGSTDVVARLIGQKLTESWGQPVLIENRPGAGGNIAAETAARAAPDGYMLFQVNVANAIGATLYPKLSYDPALDHELCAGDTARDDAVCAARASDRAGEKHR